MSTTITKPTSEDVAQLADFDHVLTVLDDGTLTDERASGLFAPDALDVNSNATSLEDWQLPLSGFTGQYGYRGPWLHDSEIISGAVGEYVLQHPGYWVAIYGQHSPEYVDCPFGRDSHDAGDCSCELELEGWTLAYRPFPEAKEATA